MTPVQNIASVYNENTGMYDYFQLSKRPGKPWTMRGNPVGTPVQDALPKLPRNARWMGQGERALGTVARGETEWKEDATRYGLIALGVYALGRLAGIIPPFRR